MNSFLDDLIPNAIKWQKFNHYLIVMVSTILWYKISVWSTKASLNYYYKENKTNFSFILSIISVVITISIVSLILSYSLLSKNYLDLFLPLIIISTSISGYNFFLFLNENVQDLLKNIFGILITSAFISFLISMSVISCLLLISKELKFELIFLPTFLVLIIILFKDKRNIRN